MQIINGTEHGRMENSTNILGEIKMENDELPDDELPEEKKDDEEFNDDVIDEPNDKKITDDDDEVV